MAAGDKKQKKGPCVYCRMEGLITADHVPPRSFYPALSPKNVITVPSCEGCNKLFALDDDYVRLVFISAEGAIGNPARDAVLPAVQRFSERKQSKNILFSFYSSLQSDYYPTAAGVLTTRQSFLIDGNDWTLSPNAPSRLCSIVRRGTPFLATARSTLCATGDSKRLGDLLETTQTSIASSSRSL